MCAKTALLSRPQSRPVPAFWQALRKPVLVSGGEKGKEILSVAKAPCDQEPKPKVKLTLVKTPRRPHPKLICVIQLLARQAARQAFAEQSEAMDVHNREGSFP